MAVTDAFRAAAAAGRAVSAALGQRNTTTTIRTLTYSGPIGAQGTTGPTTSDVVLTPSPKVVPVGTDTSWFSGGAEAAATGRLISSIYKIGPITKPFPGGGYDAATLAPAGSSSKRVLVVLAGDEFSAGGELFEIVDVDATKGQSQFITVKRTQQ